MKFGRVDDSLLIDFALPEDHRRTSEILKKSKETELQICVGCSKWTRKDLRGFYPKEIKDELSYYSTQFNSIELNATFYKLPGEEQIEIWREKVPADFKFFPKITSSISHFRRLINITDLVTKFATAVLKFDEKLGMVFLQLHDNFKPKNYDRLEKFIMDWPTEIPLAVELRNVEWFTDFEIFERICTLFEKHKITNIIVDTAGRRDAIHMRLTTPVAFIRFVAANVESDYARLDDWLEKIALWKSEGLVKLYFFIHQNFENAAPLLSSYFINKLNKEFDAGMHVPELAAEIV